MMNKNQAIQLIIYNSSYLTLSCFAGFDGYSCRCGKGFEGEFCECISGSCLLTAWASALIAITVIAIIALMIVIPVCLFLLKRKRYVSVDYCS